MAADSPRYATLDPDTVETVTFGRDYEQVEVVNLDGVELSFKIGSAGDDPAAGDTGVEVLPAAIGSLTVDVYTSGPTVVRLISATGGRVCVRGLAG